MKRNIVIALCAAVAASSVAFRGLAHADDQAWSIISIDPGEKTDKIKDPAPTIKIKVVGETAPMKPEDQAKFTLKQTDEKGRALKAVTPIKVIPFHKGPDSVGVVVLVEGHEYYFGNDKYVEEAAPPDPTKPVDPNKPIVIVKKRSAGVYDVINSALDAPGAKEDEIPTTISHAGPAGSKGALIVYSIGADVRYPMGDLAKLTADKLGAQELQKNKTSRDLAEGLRESFNQLKKASTSRKVLFVISDGFEASGSDEIKNLKKQFDAEKIDVFAFHLEVDTTYIPDDQTTKTKNKQNMQALGGSNYFKVKDAADLATKIAGVVSGSINNRFWMVFPGGMREKGKPPAGFTWDEKEHELTLMKEDNPFLDDEKKAAVAYVLTPKWGQAKKKTSILPWILGGAGVLLLGVIVLSLGGKKKQEPMPMPMPMPMPVAAPPQQIAPMPGTSNKTMAINISSGDGVPVVGWIVPINGPQAFQTFKMVAGVTKVGNVQGAHIVINDGFMSSDHAHIAMSPNGFTLIDNNSTNGTFVNERRVQRHDLIDNDVIKFGKTDCKFKTILG